MADPSDSAGAARSRPRAKQKETNASRPPVRVGRPRLVAAQLFRERGARARVRVVLERGGDEHQVEREGVGEEVMVLRLTALATLEALERLTGRSDRFALVGIKRIPAFDTSVVLVCLRCDDPRASRLLGCVPSEGSLVEAAAASVLNATNRLVEGDFAEEVAAPEEE